MLGSRTRHEPGTSLARLGGGTNAHVMDRLYAVELTVHLVPGHSSQWTEWLCVCGSVTLRHQDIVSFTCTLPPSAVGWAMDHWTWMLDGMCLSLSGVSYA